MKMIKKEDIQEISKEIKKGAVVSGIDKVSKKTYIKKENEYISKVYDGIIKGRYKFTKYKQLLKLKGLGKQPRELSIPTLRDRLMLKTIHKFYLSNIEKRKQIYEIIEEIRKDLSTESYDCFCKLDIANFFNNINRKKLLECLKSENLNENVINIIKYALKTNTVDMKNNSTLYKRYNENDKGIPQGIIISNALAEIYMKNFDEEMKKEQNIKIYRFVDDILILCKGIDNCNKLKDIVIEKLKNIELEINNDKTCNGFLKDNEIEFLGYLFKNKKVSLTKKVIQKKEKKLERVIFDYKNSKNYIIKNYKFLQWKLDLEIKGFIVNKKRYGWLNTYSSMDDMKILYHLDDCLKKILKRANLSMNIEPEKFVKQYYYIKYNNTEKMMNFDILYNTSQKKRKLLTEMLNIKNEKYDDRTIEDMYDDIIKKTIYDFEKDLDFKY